LGRLSTLSEIVDKPTVPYVTTRTYDTAGRLDTLTYPNAGTAAAPRALKVKYNYTALGYLQSITNATTNAMLYQRNLLNADSNIISENFGNGTTQAYSYEPATGRLGATGVFGPSSTTPNLLSLSYTYDTLANVSTRNDAIAGVAEVFTNDNLNRLTNVSVTRPYAAGPDVTAVTYNAIGNITSKNSTISGNVPVTVSISPNPLVISTATAGGTATGTVTASAGGGIPPYTYTWALTSGSGITLANATSTTPSFSSTALAWNQTNTAIYQVTVKDAVGTTASPATALTVTAKGPTPPALSASASTVNVASTVEAVVTTTLSGSTTITPSGGVAPYTVTWAPAAATAIATPPAGATANFSASVPVAQTVAGDFVATVKDAANQTATVAVHVAFSVAGPVTLALSPNPINCSRNNPGIGTATSTAAASAGIAPYAYSWTRLTGTRVAVANATSATASFSATLAWSENLSETYQAKVVDAAGGVATATLTINCTTPAQPTVTINPTPLNLSTATNGVAATGAATATGAGGVGPYSYSWTTTGGSGVSISNASAATVSFSSTPTYVQTLTQTYQVTLTDAAGNTATAPTQLTVNAVGPPEPAPSITISPTAWGFGATTELLPKTKSFTVTNAGGMAPFSMVLTPSNGGLYTSSAGTCPANGVNMPRFSSCALTVTYTGTVQCGGLPIQRPATLKVTVGTSAATATTSAADYVYPLTAPTCN
jgi:hypothetical protein